jgi:hypothetical protein
LDDEVQACLSGERTPEEALNRVAEAWESITEERGRKQQIAELRKDAGL